MLIIIKHTKFSFYFNVKSSYYADVSYFGNSELYHVKLECNAKRKYKYVHVKVFGIFARVIISLRLLRHNYRIVIQTNLSYFKS